MKKCTLCHIRNATKRNSHIYPQFTGNSLRMINANTNRVFMISSNGIVKKPDQDVAKEDFIFCPECESLFSNEYETPYANMFYYDRDNYKKYFKVNIRNQVTYRLYHSMNYEKYCMYVYTLLFRASISNHTLFKNFKINQDLENKLSDIILKKSDFVDYPFYTLYCPDDYPFSFNQMSAINSKETYMLAVNEFIFLFDFSKEQLLNKRLESINIKDYPQVRVITLPLSQWKAWNIDFIKNGLSEIVLKNEYISKIIAGLKNKK